jgi:hypothetical protein
VVEGRVDDAVGRLCGGAKATQLVHVTAEDLRPSTGERLDARIRTAEPDHVMTRVDKFRHEKGTDKAGRSCEKHSHPAPLVRPGLRLRSPYHDNRQALANDLDHLRRPVATLEAWVERLGRDGLAPNSADRDDSRN